MKYEQFTILRRRFTFLVILTFEGITKERSYEFVQTKGSGCDVSERDRRLNHSFAVSYIAF